MPASTAPANIDLDSPPLTPGASDLSDIGSLSDSEWFEVTSSSHGSDTDSDDDDRLQLASDLDSVPSAPAPSSPVGGLHLSLGDEWQGVPDERAAVDQQPLSIDSQPAVLNDNAQQPNLPSSDAEAAQPSEDRADAAGPAAADDVAYDPESFKLEFPDPLSSSDDMLDPNSSMNSTWTQDTLEPHSDTADTHDDAPSVSESDTDDAPAQLAIVVLGHRPSLVRTQRIVNMLVEAIADALDADHLVHHPGKNAALFGTHDIAHADGHQTYRVLATEDTDKARAAARCLAIVFFSNTRILRSFPLRDLLPGGTKFLPLIHSNASFTPPSLRSRAPSSDADSGTFSFPSSVESSILVTPSKDSGALHAARTDTEWQLFGVSAEDTLDLWPQGVPRRAVMPVNLLERRAAMLGMRDGLFAERAATVKGEVSAHSPAAAATRDELKARLAGHFREHTWTAIAVLSMLLAVLTSQVFVPRYNHVAVTMNASSVAPASPTTTLPPSPVPVAPDSLASQPSSPAPVAQAQDTSLLSSSLRNLALSVFSSEKEKAVAEAPRQPQAGPSRIPQQAGTSASLAGETKTKSPAVAASEGTASAPLTIDPPALKTRRLPLLPAGFHTPAAAEPAPATAKPTLARSRSSTREIFDAADELLAALQRNLDRARPLVKHVAARHQRARHNARRIAKRVSPQRAREGLRRVTDWSKETVANRRETIRRAKSRVSWEFNAAFGQSAEDEQSDSETRCSPKLFCGMRGRPRNAYSAFGKP